MIRLQDFWARRNNHTRTSKPLRSTAQQQGRVWQRGENPPVAERAPYPSSDAIPKKYVPPVLIKICPVHSAMNLPFNPRYLREREERFSRSRHLSWKAASETSNRGKQFTRPVNLKPRQPT